MEHTEIDASSEEKQFVLSADMAHRLAAIDIGSNSIRLIVAEPLRGGTYRILDEEKISARLGQGISATGRLDAASMEKALVGLKRMKQIAEGFQVTQLKTIATSAVREAENGAEFCQKAKEQFGLEIEVISANQEALLAFSSVHKAFDLKDKPIAVADIGGGSTEIVLALGSLVEAIYATKLGAVRLTEMFGSGPDMAGEGFEKLVDHIDRQLRKYARRPLFVPHVLFGSGGTFTSLATMVMVAKGHDGLPIRGYQTTRADVRHVLDRIRKLAPKDRTSIPGLSLDRVDIIIAGLAIVDRLMHHLGVNLLQVHNRGVRDGLLLSMIEQAAPSDDSIVQRRERAIERLSQACGGEIAHARQVAFLAAQIFEQIAPKFQMSDDDLPLLEAAARLQDVGYLINYDEHHKHSYHLILNSRLDGFSQPELELIANVARYHRGSEPKPKHSNLARLSVVDQQRVERLAAILRIAGGLDRSNTQQVEGVTVQYSPAETKILVESDVDPELDLWGARRRAGLFEKAFETKLKIEWTGRQA